MHPVQKFKEKINLLLYGSKNSTLNILRVLSVIFSGFGIGLMIYFYGFTLSFEEKEQITKIFKGLFGYYILSYGLRVLYSFEIRNFIKQTWTEGLFLGVLLADAVAYYLFNEPFLEDIIRAAGVDNVHEVHGLFLQIYLFILIALEFGKFDLDLSQIRMNPALVFMLLFAVIILGGAGMLMLPEMTNPILKDGVMVNTSMNFIDALFTSASATCVTGLMVENMMEFFSFKGQLVILGLIKVGGINIVTFGLFITFFSRFGVRVKQHDIIEDIMNRNSEHSAAGLFSKILFISIIIELIGASLFYVLMPNHHEILSVGDKIFFCLFHSVSAFNNAGLSLFSNGMATEGISNAYPLICVFTALIFVGSLGFLTILDLIDIKQLKERIRKPWKKLEIGSRIAIISNVHLLIFGTICFMIFQYNSDMLSEMNFMEKSITAIFQVINRTSGFNSINFDDLTTPLIVIFFVLMFIGGASSSTAGGIKTSTFTLIFVSIYSVIRGRKNFEIFNKNISNELIIKAFVVFIFAIINLFISMVVLAITEADALDSGKITFIQLLFEEISAFSTVGLSMGITPELSSAGRIALIINMFIGRIGTLMVLVAVSKKVMYNKYKYPDAHIMIG